MRQHLEETIIPAARKLDGFEGAYFMADRQTGKLVSVTLWRTEEARRVSEERAAQLRTGAEQESKGRTESVERFEVIAKA
jgi:heme-degrading monooxygenase HmoA